MSDKKQEEDPHRADNEDKVPKSSNMDEKKEASRTNEKSKRNLLCEELISNDETTVRESLSEIDIKNDETSNVDSDVTMCEDSKPTCLKESEIFSESLNLMTRDIKNFFSNFKQLQSTIASNKTSKRKLESAAEDLNEKSNSSPSEQCVRPTKKPHLETSAAETVSSPKSKNLTENLKPEPAAVVSISSENVDSLLPNTASGIVKCTHQEPNDIDNSTESRSSPEAGPSSEEPISTADQPNAPENPRSEDDLPISQPETTGREPLAMEYYDQPFVELNGIRSHSFPGTLEVQIIVPLFECFLNDLLELKSFLEGQQVSSAIPVEESVTDPSLVVTYSDRQLASISDEFGTGVESETARISKEAVIEWDTKYISKVDSECLSGYSEQSDLSEENSLSGSSTHRVESGSNSDEIAESSSSPTQSPDPIQSCSESDAVVLPTESPQLKPDSEHPSALEGSSIAENPVQCTESETSPNKIPETTSNPSPSSESTPTDSLRFHAELDHLNLPSEISPLLRVLNAEGRKLLNNCIEASKNFLRTCLQSTSESFQGTLLEHMRGMLDTMRRLISIREECSDLLKKCPDKNSVAGIVYILKVKYYIAKVYNQLLEDNLALNHNFNEVVKDKFQFDPVD